MSGPRLLAVERKDTGDVIGYCGLVVHGHGSPDEPELAYELLRAAHGCGYATEAGRAVVAWARRGGPPAAVGRPSGTGTSASRRVLDKLGFRETGRAEHGPRPWPQPADRLGACELSRGG